MKMLTRFTWTHWSHGKVLHHEENIWQGEHDGYQRLADPVNHKRTVILLAEDRWLVVDKLTSSKPHHYDLHWLLCDCDYGVQELTPVFGLWLRPSDRKLTDSTILIQMGLLEGNANFSIVRADPTSTRGWRSRSYGDKEPAISTLLETNGANTCFWSYFGMETDKVHIVDGVLNIASGERNTTIDLSQLNK
jgi:hypothetical protein